MNSGLVVFVAACLGCVGGIIYFFDNIGKSADTYPFWWSQYVSSGLILAAALILFVHYLPKLFAPEKPNE